MATTSAGGTSFSDSVTLAAARVNLPKASTWLKVSTTALSDAANLQTWPCLMKARANVTIEPGNGAKRGGGKFQAAGLHKHHVHYVMYMVQHILVTYLQQQVHSC